MTDFKKTIRVTEAPRTEGRIAGRRALYNLGHSDGEATGYARGRAEAEARELARVDRALAWLVRIKADVEFGKSDLNFFDPLDGGDSFVDAPHDGTGPDIRRAFVGMCESSPGFDPPPPGTVTIDEEDDE